MTVKKYMDDGLQLAAKGELQDAALSFCQAIKLYPDFPEAYQRLGEVLIPLNYWDDAQDCFCKALELNPCYPDAYNYLGVVLRNKKRLAEAEECYHQAIKYNPDYAEAYHNLGNCLKLTNRYAEAEKVYLRAIELKPDLALPRFSLATLYLLLGQYTKGWPLYESRFSWQGNFRLDIPIWQGEDLSGRNILLFYEQGLGDMLQFIRYADKVSALASQTSVWIQRPLERLLADSQDNFAIYTNKKDIPYKQFDYACSLFSLPLVFNTSPETIPNTVPYICPPKETAVKWHNKISEITADSPKIGVVWAGNPEHSDDYNRSIPFDLISQLFATEGPTWISLQLGEQAQNLSRSQLVVMDYSPELTDFAETAGLLETLDLVIAVDTAVAHLAGAMGKKTWLFLPYAPDWRWGLEGEDSLWYPTMRLFRQRNPGDWQEVLARVKTALVGGWR